jgi:CPA2 family monovalent cation:H+ antiporter-2
MLDSPLSITLVLLGMSVITVAAFRRFNLPPILGYLFVGILVGPGSFDLLEPDINVHLLAEIGVVFLLFSIGLEFSLAQMISMRSAVLGLGTTQVVLTTLIGMAAALAFDMMWQAALIIGGALALSSTAIVAKQLTEQLEMQSRHGRLALGTLLFQDLAVVPFLVVIPIFASGDNSILTGELLFALAKATAAFIIMTALGRWVLRPALHFVASAHSSELFTLAVLLIALSAAAITYQMGLSLVLGAFLAGIMLSETEYKHQIEIDIRPFRDVLMGLFFITIGIEFDITMLPQVWLETLVYLFILLFIKAGIVVGIVLIMRYEIGVAVRTALVLAQGGEFGFALMALALNRTLLGHEETQSVLAAIIISMIVAPILIRENGNIVKKLFARSYVRRRLGRTKTLQHASREVRNHVILIGFGRIGQNLINFLRQEGFEYVALDLDPVLVREAYEAGERVYYGDATHVDILRAAGLRRAKALVITIPQSHTAEKIILSARSRNPDIPIIVRTNDDLHLEELENAGATLVVPENLESSMVLASHLLKHLEVSTQEIMHLVENARNDHYHSLRGYFHGMEPETVEEAASEMYRLHTVVMAQGCINIGKRLQDLDLESLGVRIIAIRRGNIRGEAPEPHTVLQQGDALVLQGSVESLEQAEALLLSGV